MYLAIDTSTDTAGLALFDGQRVVAEEVWVAGRAHTAQLVPALDDLLRRHRLAPSDLRGVIVAQGPGSFTGLRVGMSVAKGLAFALRLPLVGVGTLEAQALPFLWAGLPIWALLEMGRGRLAAALFDEASGRPHRLVEEYLATPEELAQRVDGPSLLCGDLTPESEERIRRALGGQARLPTPPRRPRRPGDLAYLGHLRLQAGEADDPVSLAPLYLHRPPAGD